MAENGHDLAAAHCAKAALLPDTLSLQLTSDNLYERNANRWGDYYKFHRNARGNVLQ